MKYVYMAAGLILRLFSAFWVAGTAFGGLGACLRGCESSSMTALPYCLNAFCLLLLPYAFCLVPFLFLLSIAFVLRFMLGAPLHHCAPYHTPTIHCSLCLLLRSSCLALTNLFKSNLTLSVRNGLTYETHPKKLRACLVSRFHENARVVPL